MAKALERGGGNHSLPDLVALIRAGDAQAFQKGDSTIVTQIADYPNKREIVLWVAAGNWDEILELVPDLHEHAKKERCDRCVSYSHPAMHKKMKALGFKEALRVYTMELDYGQV